MQRFAMVIIIFYVISQDLSAIKFTAGTASSFVASSGKKIAEW
jgi:hypothetical protein